jgi:uncharacterized protein YsxB (DUF464 family)
MIDITFRPETMELTVSGHANYGKKGKDIVCSAVSALFYTLYESLTESEEMLHTEAVFSDVEGEGYICCHPKEEYRGNVELIYWTILNGLQMVADNYPKHVKLTIS